jgi:hypothetical protein
MAPNKKNKTRSKARSAKNARQRANKTSRKSAKKKPAQKKSVSRVAQKKTASRARARSRKKRPSVTAETELKREFQSRTRTSPRRAEDFEGLSRAEEADSESVDELVEEGNLSEAGAVAGVEEADNSDEREVHTHEVPEDDVPEEYLDKD